MRKPKRKKEILFVLWMLLLWALCSAAAYAFYFVNFESNTIQYLFPLVFSVLRFFHCCPAARSAVLGADP
jgi:hypothetical protein